MPVWIAVIGVSLGSATVRASEPDLEKAREKVRALEAEFQAVVAKVTPAVGAVSNYHATFNPKTGQVGVRLVGFGSGTVISRTGFFLTNVHVVDKAARITVALSDGVSYEAELFADTGSKGDIALLKLHGRKSWPFVDYNKGDAKKLEPGNFVFAMGNPFGHALDGTPAVTLGIVSGKSRNASERRFTYVGAVQTDAEINKGNSGGPLFNALGHFIGMNGLMHSTTGSNTGIGFAIPINQIRDFIAPMMKRQGKDVSYGYHGLHVGTAKSGGALVRRVDGGSPAAGAGVRRGDVIYKVNGKKVENRTAFVNVVDQLPEKKLVRLSFRRGNNTKTTSFKLGSQADAPRQRNAAEQALPLWERAYLGAEWKQVENAVYLTRVVATAGAGGAKLAAGDRLVRLGRTTITSIDQLVMILSYLEPGHKTRIAYKRDGRTREIGIVLSDAAEAAGIVR